MESNAFKMTLKKPWPLVLGVDISAYSLKYLLLRRAGKTLRVERFGRYSLENGEAEPEERIRQIVHWLFLKEMGLKQAKVVVGLDDPEMVVKQESFPPSLSQKELEQTISFGIARELTKEEEAPSVVFDYKAVGPDPEKEGNTTYMTMGVVERVVDDRIRPFIAEGVIPTKVTPAVMAVANLARLIPELVAEKVVGVLDIGARKSTLVFLREGRLDFFREIAVGGEDFTKAITGTIFHEGQATQLTREEAEAFKLQYGYPLGFSEGMNFRGAPLGEVGTLMRPVVERLIGEIQRSIGFYKDQSRGEEIEYLYLVGGGARLKHLPEVLTEKVDVSVSLLPVPEKIRIGKTEEQQEGFRRKFLEQAVSLSLALELSSEGNLLPSPYKKIRRATVVQRVVRCVALGIVGLVVCLTLLSQKKIGAIRERAQRLERRVAHAEKNRLLFDVLVGQRRVLEAKLVDLNLRTQQNETLIQALRLISHTVPKNLSLFYLEYGKDRDASSKGQKGQDEDEPRGRIVRVRGGSRRPPNDVGVYLGQFILGLEKSGYFSEVKLEKDLFIEEGTEYVFELVGYLKDGDEKPVQ